MFSPTKLDALRIVKNDTLLSPFQDVSEATCVASFVARLLHSQSREAPRLVELQQSGLVCLIISSLNEFIALAVVPVHDSSHPVRRQNKESCQTITPKTVAERRSSSRTRGSLLVWGTNRNSNVNLHQSRYALRTQSLCTQLTRYQGLWYCF
jgi:hypothetical protein